MMEIEEHSSYDEVYQIWNELNHQYKGGELALDWKLHQQIWNRFHVNSRATLKIFVASEAGRCLGILPFSRLPDSSGSDNAWSFGEDTIISREYFCQPARIHALIPNMPRHACSDLSCFYRPERVAGFVSRPGCVVDLKSSEEEYLESIGPKERAGYLKTLRLNEDIEVVVEKAVQDDIVGALREKYIDYWMRKIEQRVKGDAEDSRMKIAMDHVLFSRAEEMGKLVALHFFLEGKLLAANYAVLRERDRVDDYLCLRDTDRAYAKRRLGILAIIKNMQICRNLGVRYYDLSDFRAAYKDMFINTGFHYWTPDSPAEGRAAASVSTTSLPQEGAPRQGGGRSGAA